MKEHTRIFAEKQCAENKARMEREAKDDYGQPIQIIFEKQKDKEMTKGTYNIIKGNLFVLLPKEGPKLIPHVCNDIGVWGRGFTAALDKKWPEVKGYYLEYIEHCKENNNPILGKTKVTPVNDNVCIMHMIAQQGVRSQINPKPIKYKSLINCMKYVERHCKTFNESIHCPKFGAGLAGGDWKSIEKLIFELWIDKCIDVTVYIL